MQRRGGGGIASTMDLHNYLTVLRRSWLLILVLTILGGAAGTVAYLVTPKTYVTTVDFYVSTPTSQNSNPQASGQFAESRVNSYILLLSSEQLAQRVVTASGVDLTPLQVSNQITASAEINTVVIRATVSDSDPQRSLRIAQGLTQSFGPLVDDLDNVGRTSPVVLIHTVSGPTLKAGPVSPDPKLYVGGGLLAGLVVGGLVAILRGALRRHDRAPQVAADGPPPPPAGRDWDWESKSDATVAPGTPSGGSRP